MLFNSTIPKLICVKSFQIFLIWTHFFEKYSTKMLSRALGTLNRCGHFRVTPWTLVVLTSLTWKRHHTPLTHLGWALCPGLTCAARLPVCSAVPVVFGFPSLTLDLPCYLAWCLLGRTCCFQHPSLHVCVWLVRSLPTLCCFLVFLSSSPTLAAPKQCCSIKKKCQTSGEKGRENCPATNRPKSVKSWKGSFQS